MWKEIKKFSKNLVFALAPLRELFEANNSYLVKREAYAVGVKSVKWKVQSHSLKFKMFDGNCGFGWLASRRKVIKS